MLSFILQHVFTQFFSLFSSFSVFVSFWLYYNSHLLLIIWLNDSGNAHFSNPSSKPNSLGMLLFLLVKILLLPSTSLSRQLDVYYSTCHRCSVLFNHLHVHVFHLTELSEEWTVLWFTFLYTDFEKLQFVLSMTHIFQSTITLWMKCTEHI